MAKFEIQAGAKIDIPSREENRADMRTEMTSWFAEVAKGDRYRRISNYATAVGTAVTIGDTAGHELVVPAGFMWSLKSLAIPTGYDPAASQLALYVGAVDVSACVHPDLGLYTSFDQNQVVLHPGDKLIVAGTATADQRVWITGQIRELPVSLGWRLG